MFSAQFLIIFAGVIFLLIGSWFLNILFPLLIFLFGIFTLPGNHFKNKDDSELTEIIKSEYKASKHKGPGYFYKRILLFK